MLLGSKKKRCAVKIGGQNGGFQAIYNIVEGSVATESGRFVIALRPEKPAVIDTRSTATAQLYLELDILCKTTY